MHSKTVHILYTWRSWTALSEVASLCMSLKSCCWSRMQWCDIRTSVESQKPWGKEVSVVVERLSSQLDVNEVDVWAMFTLTWAVCVAVSATLLGSLLFRILEYITQTIQLGFTGSERTVQQLRVVCIALVYVSSLHGEWVVSSSA